MSLRCASLQLILPALAALALTLVTPASAGPGPAPPPAASLAPGVAVPLSGAPQNITSGATAPTPDPTASDKPSPDKTATRNEPPTPIRAVKPADAKSASLSTRPATGHRALDDLRLATPGPAETGQAVRMALVVTLLALLPALAICMTPFIRIVVVLSMIRHALGMPETPPNQVLVSLALFLTIFVMSPTLYAVNDRGLQPFLAGSVPLKEAIDQGGQPLRTFMLRQVHDQDLKTVYEISRQPLPARASDVGLMSLTTAFMLNELRVSFKIGFVVFLPFLLIDLVVSSILLSLGMLMVPPSTISLPIKILMFVLIDGWSLILQGVVGSIR